MIISVTNVIYPLYFRKSNFLRHVNGAIINNSIANIRITCFERSPSPAHQNMLSINAIEYDVRLPQTYIMIIIDMNHPIHF